MNVSVIRLRREKPNIERSYEMPLYPLPPILGILLNILLGLFLLYRDPITGVIAAVWMILGLITYYILKRTGYGGGEEN